VSLPKCNPDIFENGVCVCIAAGGNAAMIEELVKMIRRDTEQPVDWHYAGGRAVILTTGDVEKVRQSVKLNEIRFLYEF